MLKRRKILLHCHYHRNYIALTVKEPYIQAVLMVKVMNGKDVGMKW